MADTKKTTPKSLSPKKEMKKEVTVKLEAALAEIKSKLSEKEFNQRIKKAAKLITHGLNNAKAEKKLNGKAIAKKVVAKKKQALKTPAKKDN